MNKELKSYYKSIEDLTKLFCKRYFNEVYKYNTENWVGRDIGGIIEINDYYFSMSNIEHAIKHNATKKELFKWYDYSLDKASRKPKKGELPQMNLENYLKYFRGFSWKDEN